MTLDHDQTANQFVRDYILEKNNMRVGELRELIQTYRTINETIRKMRERLDALKALQAIIAELDGAYEQKFREHWIAKRAEWLIVRAANRDLRDKSGARRSSAMRRKVCSTTSMQRSERIDAEIERLSIAILEHDTKTGRGALQQALKAAEQSAAATSAQFTRRMAAVRLLEPLGAMRGLGFDEHAGAMRS